MKIIDWLNIASNCEKATLGLELTSKEDKEQLENKGFKKTGFFSKKPEFSFDTVKDCERAIILLYGEKALLREANPFHEQGKLIVENHEWTKINVSFTLHKQGRDSASLEIKGTIRNTKLFKF